MLNKAGLQLHQQQLLQVVLVITLVHSGTEWNV